MPSEPETPRQGRGGPGLLRRLRDLPNDSPAKTILVALAVCLVCSAVVASTAVLLRPRQLANQERERQGHIMEIVERLPGIGELFETAAVRQVEAQVVELATGATVREIDPAAYDQRKAAKDPQLSVAIPSKRDIAGLKRRARYATVYLVRRDGEIALIILPVHGAGYASTLYGYLALEGDANTVVALSFFEHAETPGLGAGVDDLAWRDQWQSKKVRDEAGRLRIAVAEGRVDPAGPAALYQVDGLSGATRTGQGVTDLLRFWLGEDGFGPFLRKIQSLRE
jgi:Na+-transporting NADH:ubiquinone oxidoreductase subunit C